ncbi:sensor histidine kinase [Cohnella panacarvi]|uniref:sensor histidine kinase n=1 Tax=Cohnella panacarvi TaxID=400776 RepID=UPI000558530C|nr:sensor histidine kinase [Cohnella panacarvi]
MQKWHQTFHRNTGLSPYVWVVFCILPFYFIIHSSSMLETVIGITMVITFFGCYALSFLAKGWQIYFWTGAQIAISVAMTVVYGYVYFSLFLAFFIGNIRNRAGFFTLYTIHLVGTIATINYGFVTKNSLLLTQFPFVLISLIAVILLPISTYNRNKREQLEGQLENANKRISDLVKLEERQRIARDLHDTLGQKLSLIGLKSDLAMKLISRDPDQAQAELLDVRLTARSALKEVREIVTNMRGMRIEDEIVHMRQMLKAAEIELSLEGDSKSISMSLLSENVVSMCLKEAVNNIVKHSHATSCTVSMESTDSELLIRVTDNGVGLGKLDKMPDKPLGNTQGNGLRGMKERLEFINGSLEIESGNGTTLLMRVPNLVKQPLEEVRS